MFVPCASNMKLFYYVILVVLSITTRSTKAGQIITSPICLSAVSYGFKDMLRILCVLKFNMGLRRLQEEIPTWSRKETDKHTHTHSLQCVDKTGLALLGVYCKHGKGKSSLDSLALSLNNKRDLWKTLKGYSGQEPVWVFLFCCVLVFFFDESLYLMPSAHKKM